MTCASQLNQIGPISISCIWFSATLPWKSHTIFGRPRRGQCYLVLPVSDNSRAIQSILPYPRLVRFPLSGFQCPSAEASSQNPHQTYNYHFCNSSGKFLSAHIWCATGLTERQNGGKIDMGFNILSNKF